MGFLDVCKSVLEYIQEKNEEFQNEYQRYRDIYDDRDDEALKRYYQSSTGVKKAAIASLLRERGYGNQE